MSAVISLAVLISIFFTLDLINTPKKGHFYIRNLLQLIVVSIPSIFKSVDAPETDFLVVWHKYFYCVFTLCFILFVVGIYFFHYKKIVSSLSMYDGIEKKYSFIDFLQIGNKAFQDDVNKAIEKSVNVKTKIVSSIFKSMRTSLPRYMQDLNLALADNSSKNYNLIDFACFVLKSFISNFLSHTDARFSIREYDKSTDSMVAIFSTRQDELPSAIPLNKPNLIALSMKSKKPEIYSRNKKQHYDTKGSIKDNVFDNYVTYCVLCDPKKEKPLLSVNLDVKGIQPSKRMMALVDNAIFTIVCDTIKIKSMQMAKEV